MKTGFPLIAALALIAPAFEFPAALGQESAPASEPKRVLQLFEQFRCDCPKENWTRTLAGCFEPCVERQRNLVRGFVADKLTDEKIFQEMIKDAGTEKVLARASLLPKLVPYAILGLLGCVAAMVLFRMLRQTVVEDANEDRHPGLHEEFNDRVEEELNRLKD